MTSSIAPNINTLWARAFVDELARCGLRAVCISPGSRSTPLVVQFAAHPDIEDISIVDERSAAFFALGMARVLREPVALVCTSGTAAANYFPAICEASESDIPLLVLTADRPPELQDAGASQAMNQLALYGDRVRWFHQVAQPEARADKLRYIRATACKAWQRAGGLTSGPVHLNLPFRKPLEPIDVGPEHRDFVPDALAEADPTAVAGRGCGMPFVQVCTGQMAAQETLAWEFADRVASAKRPLLLAGADERGVDYRDALRDFAALTGAPIAAEPTSGLRHWAERGPNVLASTDYLFESDFYQNEGAPDLIIRTGRAPLLWSAQALVRRFADVEQIAVGPNNDLADPDHIVDWQIVCDEQALFEAAAAQLDATSSADTAWLASHRAAEEAALGALGELLNASESLCAPRMWHELGSLLPDRTALFVSNSMPIRNLDTFMSCCDSDVDVYFNRGLNGIDGINSTGLGIACARRVEARSAAPTVLVTGDVALRHDLGGLALAHELGLDATIIVVDNDGGGIFEYLPIADFGAVHERHFATPTQTERSQPPLGGMELVEPQDWKTFRDAVARSLEASGVQLVRVRTDRVADKELRERLRHAVAGRIDELAATSAS